ncbi:hypothetical protein J5N97_021541 [Dioscorea zingiberensis]|uniref:Uncharacterized protein n=1 Tax=Dioscorea zingiberensis TaxID=325984 RepID=A0A9D5CHW2_9LILI|nr:hypothetical protein J5N97_021541 [Dioscorea zingiberensis]
MDAICSIGVSTKRGRRNEGFIGERGFGFKSVFQVSNQPHIISNRFLIHSDFVLTPSMEINFDSKWNKWVFDCVPTAFVNAILAFVNTGNKRETLVGLFLRKHLPFEAYSISKPQGREGGDVRYEKPRDVRGSSSRFRKLLHSLKNANVHLDGMQPGEKSLFFEPLDNERDGKVFQYHGVGAPDSDPDWYGKFIQDCRIVPQLSEELYLTFYASSLQTGISLANAMLLKFLLSSTLQRME